VRLVMTPLLGLALLTGGCDKQSPAPTQGNAAEGAAADSPEPTGTLDISHRGEAMPATPFEGPKGEKLTLAAFKGKPLLVNLWATWCGPCVAEMPTLDALADREKARLQVMVISQDSKGRELVDPWWAQRSFKLLKPYLDKDSAMLMAFKSDVLPTTVMYDADGKEVWRVVGAMDWDGPRANTLMAEALEAKPQ
jgi:thiol-disulfide isomerase/thioredoxin